MEGPPEVFLQELDEKLSRGVELGSFTREEADEFREAYVLGYLGRLARQEYESGND